MATNRIPTSADIYLEVNGSRVAVVQSYKVTATRSSKAIYAFGQEAPVATIRGQGKYTLELTRIYATDEAIRDGIDFMELDNFSLVVCKPDRNVIYSGCQWSQMQESAEVGGNVMEKVTVEAARRNKQHFSFHQTLLLCFQQIAVFAAQHDIQTGKINT